MAMRCLGRAFAAAFGAVFLAAETRPFDVMVLRAAGLAVLLSPVHFFFTAVLAAGLDAAFCFAIVSLPFLDQEKLAQTALRWVGKLALGPPNDSQRFLPDQCSRKTPSTARSSAGLTSLECATVTEN